MIVGLGIDVTEVPRIAALLERWGDRFAHKVFTAGERAYAAARARPAEHLAARFAAKEATLKALGVPSGLSWHEMEVDSGPGGRPELALSGRALEAARAIGIARLHLSITHAGGVAAAVVVAESAERG
jgi:holo-[acyl-carrier protein] synthase